MERIVGLDEIETRHRLERPAQPRVGVRVLDRIGVIASSAVGARQNANASGRIEEGPPQRQHALPDEGVLFEFRHAVEIEVGGGVTPLAEEHTSPLSGAVVHGGGGDAIAD